MTRLILRLAVAMATFSMGAAIELLLTVNRHTPATRPPVSKTAAVNADKAPAQLSGSSLPSDLVWDYDPKEFNPRGDYYILGRKPKHFREFACLELAVDHERPLGVVRIETWSDRTYNGHYVVSGSVTRQRLALVAIPSSEEDFEYNFSGEFSRGGVLSDAGRNEAVLKGKLTKSRNGVKIAECEVRFRIEYLGC
jgi:hypothetical protein